jgi:hypothetical protein
MIESTINKETSADSAWNFVQIVKVGWNQE